MKKIIILILLASAFLSGCVFIDPPPTPPTIEEMEQLLKEGFDEEFTVTSMIEVGGESHYTGYTVYPNANPEFEFQAWEYTARVTGVHAFGAREYIRTDNSYASVRFMHYLEGFLEENTFKYQIEPRQISIDGNEAFIDGADIVLVLEEKQEMEFYEKFAQFLKDSEDKALMTKQRDEKKNIYHPYIYIYIYLIGEDDILYFTRLHFSDILFGVMDKNPQDPFSEFTAQNIIEEKYNTWEQKYLELYKEQDSFVYEVLQDYPQALSKWEYLPERSDVLGRIEPNKGE
ncbi:MAG: hypothetical protein R3Y24_02720 [Eubacteriales bacterium]